MDQPNIGDADRRVTADPRLRGAGSSRAKAFGTPATIWSVRMTQTCRSGQAEHATALTGAETGLEMQTPESHKPPVPMSPDTGGDLR